MSLFSQKYVKCKKFLFIVFYLYNQPLSMKSLFYFIFDTFPRVLSYNKVIYLANPFLMKPSTLVSYLSRLQSLPFSVYLLVRSGVLLVHNSRSCPSYRPHKFFVAVGLVTLSIPHWSSPLVSSRHSLGPPPSNNPEVPIPL